MSNRKAMISETLVRVLNKALANQRKPQRYGLEDMLYPAEMHMVMLIGQNPASGVTELAAKAGTTKGAVSQMIQRLVNKGLICKSSSPASGRRVFLELTNRGKVAFYSHERLHEESDRGLILFIERLHRDQVKVLEKFLMLVEQGIDKRSET
ncbi:MAG: winged helix-turn-helix transcriptional regulator [Bacteroidales bacterium]|nr:winged helix-turn-helix transcriptional regulator [Bacteroidales bacterium]